MDGPLEGIRVLEVANYLAAPSAAAIMADMGADVVKVEPPGGDHWRLSYLQAEYGLDRAINYGFEMDNRGKRSITLDLAKEEAVDAVHKIADKADVFITNLLPRRMERFKLRYDDLSTTNPRLVYLAFNGYGPEGPQKDRPGYDHTAFWASSGIMSLFSDPGQPPVDLQIGMGDHTTGPLLLAGVLAALFERERSGKGQRVTTSLLNMGLWVIGVDVQHRLAGGRDRDRYQRTEAPDPMYNTYMSQDGHWFIILMHPIESHWIKLCRAFGKEELADDPRFKTAEGRAKHAKEIVVHLDEGAGGIPFLELGKRMDAEKIIWAPMRTVWEALEDPQVEANGYVTEISHPKHGNYRTLNTPLHFDRSAVGPKGPAPEVGQHTTEVLLEVGYSKGEIERINDLGAFG